MKKILIPAALIAAAILSGAAKKNDPTLMTVNGKPVKVSEFTYLYNKNNQQQAEPQTLDEYVDMFVNYRLKVADAEAAGLDTTAAFKKEYDGYCDDLAKPFLTDSTVVEKLSREAYERMKKNVKVSHIMLPVGRTPDERMANRARLDSIRTAILNGADFGDMAVKYSSDRSAQRNRGSMGYVKAGSFPYPFEYAAYNTPVGQISEVIDDAPYGWHIIRVDDVRPDAGEWHARHILKLTRGLDEAAAAAKKAQIDSIYNVLAGGADFAEVAAKESEDPGSARRGGDVGWFGSGRMVPEFENAVAGAADGQITKPFATSYGYHIVERLGHRDLADYESMRQNIAAQIGRDSRSAEPRRAKVAQLRSQYGAKLDPKGMAKADALIDKHQGIDSVTMTHLLSDWTTIGVVGGHKVKLSDAAAAMPKYDGKVSAAAGKDEFRKAAETALDNATVETARENLAAADENYRNLTKEYRDGILLFDVSNDRVWDRSNKDTKGLEDFFNLHRANYTWDAPRYKGVIVSATNDSIADAAKAYLKANPVGLDSIVAKLRDQFGRNVKVERKLFPKGEDAVIDYVAFGGEKPAAQGKWTSFFLLEGKLLNAPEEVGDVRSAVVNDYQKYLEQEWLTELKAKYPVVINKKELEKIRKAEAAKK